MVTLQGEAGMQLAQAKLIWLNSSYRDEYELGEDGVNFFLWHHHLGA